MSQFRHCLREGSQRHGPVRLPTLIRNRYVHSHIRRRHIAQQMVSDSFSLITPVPCAARNEAFTTAYVL